MKAKLTNADTEVEQIVERMRSVRAVGGDHVADLQVEAKRLVDWKEYVRAKPILSIAAASLLGFGIVRKAASVISQPAKKTSVTGEAENDSRSFRSSLTSTIATLATSIASNAIKSYITSFIQRGSVERDANDRFRHNAPTD